MADRTEEQMEEIGLGNAYRAAREFTNTLFGDQTKAAEGILRGIETQDAKRRAEHKANAMDYKFKASGASVSARGIKHHYVEYFKFRSRDEAEQYVEKNGISGMVFSGLFDVKIEEAPPGKYYNEDGHLADLDEEHKAAEERVRQEEAERKEEGRRKYGENFEVSNDVLIKYKGPGGAVSIPDGIKNIGRKAFEHQSNLTSVSIPSSVTYIQESAFDGCYGLASVKLPEGVLFSHDKQDRTLEHLVNNYDYYGRKAGTYSESGGKWSRTSGCYVATAVYGSYDCPEVWTLRRYRDYGLAKCILGRLFIRAYYAVSPTLVKWFGKKTWFKNMWRKVLDRKVRQLRSRGIEDTPFIDRAW